MRGREEEEEEEAQAIGITSPNPPPLHDHRRDARTLEDGASFDELVVALEPSSVNEEVALDARKGERKGVVLGRALDVLWVDKEARSRHLVDRPRACAAHLLLLVVAGEPAVVCGSGGEIEIVSLRLGSRIQHLIPPHPTPTPFSPVSQKRTRADHIPALGQRNGSEKVLGSLGEDVGVVHRVLGESLPVDQKIAERRYCSIQTVCPDSDSTHPLLIAKLIEPLQLRPP